MHQPIGCWAGGTCGNVLAILAYLGWDSYPVSRLDEDAAAEKIRADLLRWGVKLDWIACPPAADTPIIVQEIRKEADGRVTHRFSWSCPNCGGWLPAFKPITREAAERVRGGLRGTDVFFLDRVSRAAVTLAKEAAARGAVVVFEPSGRGNDALTGEIIEVAHVVKYSTTRRKRVPEPMIENSAIRAEIQTLGEHGLRYRHRFGKRWSEWEHLAAVRAARVEDTCGAGDWCTAGLIARSALGGQEEFRRGGAAQLRTALRYGQTLAAWACGFEGARGGMYAVERQTFEAHIDVLRHGASRDMNHSRVTRAANALLNCPACERV